MSPRPWIQLTLAGHSFAPTPTPEAVRVATALRRLGLWVEMECKVVDDGGVLVGWADICIPALRLYVEVDGRHHRSDPIQIWRDAYKTAICAQRGYHVLRVPNWDAVHVSVFALSEKLKGVLVPFARLRGRTWAEVVLARSICCIEAANENS